jgi:hypothetical protein
MTYRSGEIVRIDFPSHPWHGKTVEVVADEEWILSHPEAEEPIWGRVIFCRGDVRDAIGFHAAHIAGTVEAQQRRRWDAAESDDRQGDLAL